MDVSVDDLPDWAIRGCKVEPEWRKRRKAKRDRVFVVASWSELMPALQALGTDQATKLYLVLLLQRKLQRTRRADGWIELIRHRLVAVGLANNNLSKAVAKLEKAGLVEVQRRPGKRPLLRLAPKAEA
jgi:hypothetical protein